MKVKTKEIIFCAIFAALTAILSQISIPLPFTPVPINLATISVCIGAGLLGAKIGALSQVVYVIIGAIGVPVFANFTGGLGIVVGPTGGYIIGYIVAAILIGVIINRFGKNLYTYIIAMVIGILGCYTIGTAWFMYLTQSSFGEALVICVVPFLIGDVLKIVLSAFLVKRLKGFI